MSEFTPGPWETGYRVNFEGGYNQEIFDGAGNLIATAAWYAIRSGNTTTINREDNANLIAASPDMYESLEECAGNLAFLANHLEGRIGEGAQAEMTRLAEEAFEILAKARGET